MDLVVGDASALRHELREREEFETFLSSRIANVVQKGCVLGIRLGEVSIDDPSQQMIVVYREAESIGDIYYDFQSHNFTFIFYFSLLEGNDNT